MSQPKKSTTTQEDQRRRDAVERAEQAKTKRNQPHDILQKSVMQRQAKGAHQQDGK